jgi:nucleoside-diphosphate-sugar epimerase
METVKGSGNINPFFYDLIDKAGRGEDIYLYGSHDPKRNYIHIDDVTRVLAEVVKRRLKENIPVLN